MPGERSPGIFVWENSAILFSSAGYAFARNWRKKFVSHKIAPDAGFVE
jgi:hypothetical protein